MLAVKDRIAPYRRSLAFPACPSRTPAPAASVLLEMVQTRLDEGILLHGSADPAGPSPLFYAKVHRHDPPVPFRALKVFLGGTCEL